MKMMNTRNTAWILALGLVACGGDDGTPATPEPDVTEDVVEIDTPTFDEDTGSDTGSDAAEEVTEDVVASDVPNGEFARPARVQVTVTPQRTVYTTGLTLTPAAEVVDELGEPMDGFPVTFSVDDVNLATDNGDGTFATAGEGAVTFIGCVEHPELSEELCGTRRIVIDDGRPTILLEEPEPGSEMILGERGRDIEVSGRVVNSGGDTLLYVNGNAVAVNPADGRFATEVPALYGINHVDVVATDLLSNIEARAGADVMGAFEYFDYVGGDTASNLSAFFDDGLLLQLTQEFMDANVLVLPDPESGLVVTEDLAGILELLLTELDISSQIPDPAIDSSGFFLRVLDVDIGEPRIDVNVTVRGIEVFIDIPEMYISTEGSFTVGGGTPLSLNGGVIVSIAGFQRLELRKRPDMDIEVGVELGFIALEDVIGDFESAQANAILALLEGLLFEQIEDLAVDAVQEAFADALPPLLLGAFESIESSLTGQTFELDLGFGDPIILSFDAVLDTMTPTRRSDITAALDLTVGSNSVPTQESFGIPLEVAYDTEPGLFRTARIQLAMNMAVINGLMHTLWNSGLLELDASDVIPDSLAFLIDRAVVSGKLAPVIREARPGESEFDLLITLGQLELTLGRLAQEDVIGLYVVAGVSISVADNQIVIDIQPEPTIQAWEIEIGGETRLFENVADLRDLIISGIWPLLSEELGEQIAIDLPAIDLSALGDFAPTLSDFTLEIVLDRELLVRDGYLIIDAGLNGTVDLSE